MENSLPAVPGTVVSFASSFEGEEDIRYCATLLLGIIDEQGEPLYPIWASGFIEDLDDETNSFAEDFLRAQDLTVLWASEALGEPLELGPDEFDELDYGSVVEIINGHGEQEFYVYTPLYLDEDGEVAEALWINSFGGVLDPHSIDSIKLRYRGSRPS